ncbi:MAG: alpha/beta fold hydrolase [bacterium]|nr:alpha/beta fold hydrolase [bacterium]MDZ4296549.1 alpha/beta fold hydrolase [Patescibacteria group bacterium]
MKKLLFVAGVLAVVSAAAVYLWGRRQGESAALPPTPSPSAGVGLMGKAQERGSRPHPVSLPALMVAHFDGRDLTLGRVLAENEAYTRHYITYKSGALTISGVMNVPKGTGPFPVLILNHGYIDPAVYTNGRGLRREQDYLARRGYVVLHSDYRNHAQSGKDPDAELHFRLGYTEDVINAAMAVKNSTLDFLDRERIGMLGHSMGGGVALNVLVVQPALVDAAVLFAPVSADYRENFTRWVARRPETAAQIVERYGTPEGSPEFWDNISAVSFLDRIAAPVMIHHGTADASVPLAWSERLRQALEEKKRTAALYIYPGEPHEFIRAWTEVMERTVSFFDRHLKV